MSNLFWLADEQMAKLSPFFPKSHGKPRVDDKRVLSGIIFINRNGLRRRDAPRILRAAQDALQSLEALERERHLRPDDGRPGCRTQRKEDRYDRRDLSESPPHRDQYGREKRGCGRLIRCPAGHFKAMAREGVEPRVG